MKVLFISSSPVIHTLRPIRWLLDNGCEVIHLYYQENPTFKGNPGYRFMKYPKIGTGFVRRLFPGKLSNEFFHRTTAWSLRALWRFLKPDIVHVQNVDHLAYQSVLAKLKPLVLTIWGGSDVNTCFEPDVDPEFRLLVSRSLSGADIVLTNGPGMDQKCEHLAGKKLNIEPLYIGVDTNRFRPGYEEKVLAWKQKLNISAEERTILSCRAFAPYYRHHDVLEAFHEIASQTNCGLVLVFLKGVWETSETAEYEKELRARAQKLGLDKMVRWIDYVEHEEMPGIYALADVVVNNPKMDAFPVTFLEAGACKRPVVSVRLPSYVGTFAEKYYRMVEPGDIDGLAEALLDALNEPAESRDIWLSEVRKIVQDQFEEKLAAKKLLKIYRSLIEKRGLGSDAI